MGGSPCNIASLYVPPIAWGATSAAPDNSTRDRNVDWKCTFTWPGLAPVASAMVVELLVALLYHPLGADTPYPTPSRRGGRGAAAEVVTFSPDLGGAGGAGPWHYRCWDLPLARYGGRSSPTPWLRPPSPPFSDALAAQMWWLTCTVRGVSTSFGGRATSAVRPT